MTDNEEIIKGADAPTADGVDSADDSGKSATDKKTASADVKKASGGEKKAASGEKKNENGKKKSSSSTKEKPSGTRKSEGDSNKNAVKKPESEEEKTVSEIPAAEVDEVAEAVTEEADFLPLESLLYDSDEHIVAYETPEESANYESFFRSYKELIDGVLADARIRRENAEAQANSSVISEQATDSVSTDTQAIEESVETSTEEIPARESTDEDSGTAEAVTNENPAEVSVATDSLTDEENTDDLPVVTEHTEFLTDDAAINEDESVAISEESDDQATDETVSEPVAEENAEQTAVSEEETEQISFEFDEESDESAAEVTEVTKEAEKPRRDLDKYDPEKPRGVDSVFEFLELFAFTLVAVMLLTTFFFRYSRVDGGSMDKTLADGDHLLISNFMYTPERGDIIVFEDYGTELYEPLVKRVIGVAGDTVEVTITGDVIVNGELLDEPYVYVTPGRHPTMIHGKWYVEEGEVFVLGDHRDVSKDSREFGPIRADSILGEAKLRFYPFDKFGGLD